MEDISPMPMAEDVPDEADPKGEELIIVASILQKKSRRLRKQSITMAEDIPQDRGQGEDNSTEEEIQEEAS